MSAPPPRLPDNYGGLSSVEASIRLLEYGRNELPEPVVPLWSRCVRTQVAVPPAVLWVAIVIELATQEWVSAAILLALQFLVAAGSVATASRLQSTLTLATTARTRRDGEWQDLDVALLVPGDTIALSSGCAVPADCTINADPCDTTAVPELVVDETCLTGEALPVTVVAGGEWLKMSSTVLRGDANATVQATGLRTLIGQFACLLEPFNPPSEVQNQMIVVSARLTLVAVMLCAACFAFLMGHFQVNFATAVQAVAMLLVASTPVALRLAADVALLVGVKDLATQEAVVMRLATIESLAAVDMLCSDKTGTLTPNKMEIQQECPIFMTGEDRETVLMHAALASQWNVPPRDATDVMVLGAAPLERCDKYRQIVHKPYEARTKRCEATLIGPDGSQFKVARGSPSAILSLCANARAIRDDVDAAQRDFGERGMRTLAVARTMDGEDDDRWFLLGILTFLDPPFPDSRRAVADLKRLGVQVKVLTGDHSIVAQELARRLQMNPAVVVSARYEVHFPFGADYGDAPSLRFGDEVESVDIIARIFPEEKRLVVDALRARGWTCAMVGDGVDDVPALRRADVAIVVKGATDAAKSAADVVLRGERGGIGAIASSLQCARHAVHCVASVATFQLAASIHFVVFLTLAIFLLRPVDYGAVQPGADQPFFRLPLLMVLFVVLLNNTALGALGFDSVAPPQQPLRWNTAVNGVAAVVLGCVACISSLLLLWMSLDSIDDYENSWYYKMGLPPADYPHTVTTLYLQVSVSHVLTLVSARTQTKPFFAFGPSKGVVAAICASVVVSSLLASLWPESSPDGTRTMGLALLSSGQPAMASQHLMPVYVWLYCMMWWFVQDWIKVLSYKIIGVFGYRATAMSPALRGSAAAAVSGAPQANVEPR